MEDRSKIKAFFGDELQGHKSQESEEFGVSAFFSGLDSILPLLDSKDWRESDELSVEARRFLGAVIFYSLLMALVPKIDNKSHIFRWKLSQRTAKFVLLFFPHFLNSNWITNCFVSEGSDSKNLVLVVVF